MELNSFENFIIHCCRLPEWELRDYLKAKLCEAGFVYKEDGYRGYRGGRYNKVHNLLFRRGDNPSVCLVAHTDVCRDHEGEFPPVVTPVIKEIEHFGEMARVIQDEHCSVQVGGDDRVGVAVNAWIALNTGYDLGLLFTTDEEVGLESASAARFDEFLSFDIFLQVDRGNQTKQLVTSIGERRLISQTLATRLFSIANEIGLPRKPVDGLITDVAAIKQNYPSIQAVNMTCGYWNSRGAQKNEYIHIQEVKDTMAFVNAIIKDFDLNGCVMEEEPEEEEIEDEDIEVLSAFDDSDQWALTVRLLEENGATLNDEGEIILFEEGCF